MRRSSVQHLRRIGMGRACQLLRHSDQTIDWIVSEVGHAKTALFAHSFKKMIGVSPDKYRRYPPTLIR